MKTARTRGRTVNRKTTAAGKAQARVKSTGAKRTARTADAPGRAKNVIRKKAVPTRAQRTRVARQLDPVQRKIVQAIDTGNTEEILKVLRIGTEEPEELSYEHRNFAYTQLLAHFRTPTQKAEFWKLVRYCSARPEIVARQLTCAVLDTFWKDRREEAERTLLNLARDEDWEVREYASATMARILKNQFRANYPHLRSWAGHPDPSIRRQVLIALVAMCDAHHPEWAEPLLQLVEINLKDRDPYVRRNLGPFALGKGLLRHYPQPTLHALLEWTKSKDETVRWNLAMALTVPWVKDHWEEALEILRAIGSDKRRMVWQAVSLGLQNLLRLRPDEVEPRLQDWMKEPSLRVAVSTALSAYRSS